jgi:two-component system response regulator DevR
MQDLAGRTTTVYLLDDHDIVRRGLRDLLAPARDVHVVGDSGSAERAVAAIPALRPDVMVLDLQLQDGSGIDVCRRVRAVAPDVRGLLLTSAADDDALLAAVLAGAAGYVVKLSSTLDVVDAVRRVGAGRAGLEPGVRSRAGDLLRARAESLRPALSDHEHQLLAWVADGLTDPEVAERAGAPEAETAAAVAGLARRLSGTDGIGPAPGAESTGRHRLEAD